MVTRSGVVFRNESRNSPFGMEGNSVPVVANNGGERDSTVVEGANVVDNGTHANFQEFMKFITESREQERQEREELRRMYEEKMRQEKTENDKRIRELMDMVKDKQARPVYGD